jgi:hypothetical protein
VLFRLLTLHSCSGQAENIKTPFGFECEYRVGTHVLGSCQLWTVGLKSSCDWWFDCYGKSGLN